MAKFQPKEHMTNLKGKDYLEVKWRLVWFRDEQPKGIINTEVVSFEPLVIKATVLDENGAQLSSGHGSAQTGKNAVWSGREIEKAETAAIGRALAHAGYGTQFDADDDLDNLADSPVERSNGHAPDRLRQQTQEFEATGYNIDDVWEAVKDAGFNDRKHVENVLHLLNVPADTSNEQTVSLLKVYRQNNPKKGRWYEDGDYMTDFSKLLVADYGVTLTQVMKDSGRQLKDFASGDAVIEYVKQNVR